MKHMKNMLIDVFTLHPPWDHHDIAEIWLKVAFNTITLTTNPSTLGILVLVNLKCGCV